MIKSLRLVILFLIVFVGTGFAQERPTTIDSDIKFLFNSENQNIANQSTFTNGFIDVGEVENCGFIENHKRNTQKYGLASTVEFEAWMVEKRAELDLQQMNQFGGVVLQIPYVVHVLHNGTPVNNTSTQLQLGDYNLSPSQIASQIAVINEDFNKMNTDRANSPEWDAVAANLELEFVPALYDGRSGLELEEPGINRVNVLEQGWPEVPYATSYIESVVKPTINWDRNEVLNFYVIPIPPNNGRQVLGYAQFPSMSTLPGLNEGATAAETDGIVMIPEVFGSVNYADPSFYMFAGFLGRTTTHELGHYFGFRHVWGDGGCAVDDFCEDTPPMNVTGEGLDCDEVSNSCDDTNFGYTIDLPDMKENFMSYISDDCMNLFTTDQLRRAEVVFENSPGRGSLADSDIDEERPAIVQLDRMSEEIIEGERAVLQGDCEEPYTDVITNVILTSQVNGGAPSVSYELDVANTTATEGIDFEILNTSRDFVFTNGESTLLPIRIRVFDDRIQEVAETVTIKLINFNANGSDAGFGSNQSFTLTIENNDFNVIDENFARTVIFEDDLEGPFQWLQVILEAGNNSWSFGDRATPPLTGVSSYITNDSAGFTYDGSSESAYAYTNISTITFEQNIDYYISFDWTGVGEDFMGRPIDFGSFAFIDEGITQLLGVGPALLGNTGVLKESILLPDNFKGTGANWRPTFYWENDFSIAGATPFGFDNLTIERDRNILIETQLTNGVNVPISPNSSIDIFSSYEDGGELIATITNNSDFNYGCTTVTVDRAGLGSSPFYQEACAGEEAFLKTIFIDTEFSSVEDLDVTLYYTQTETKAWENATGLSLNDLYIVKDDGAISDVSGLATESAFFKTTATAILDYGYAFKASINAAAKGGYGLVPASSNAISYTVELNNEQVDINLSNVFNDDSKIDFYIVQKSADNANWADLEVISANGSGQYFITDLFPLDGRNFYRVKAIGTNCGELISKEVFINFETTGNTKVYPNPASDEVTVLVSKDDVKGATGIGIYNSEGRMVRNQDLVSTSGVLRWTFDVSTLSSGMYYIKIISSKGGNVHSSFIKVN